MAVAGSGLSAAIPRPPPNQSIEAGAWVPPDVGIVVAVSVALINHAFGEKGKLTDPEAEAGEQRGVREFLAALSVLCEIPSGTAGRVAGPN